MTLNMVSDESPIQIDYSKSFWIKYEPKTGHQIVISKANRDFCLNPPYYFPEAWEKASNADVPEVEQLDLDIVKGSAKIIPSYVATVNPDPNNPETLVIHSLQKGKAKLTFDVTTKYGDKWTLEYDVIVNR